MSHINELKQVLAFMQFDAETEACKHADKCMDDVSKKMLGMGYPKPDKFKRFPGYSIDTTEDCSKSFVFVDDGTVQGKCILSFTTPKPYYCENECKVKVEESVFEENPVVPEELFVPESD